MTENIHTHTHSHERFMKYIFHKYTLTGNTFLMQFEWYLKICWTRIGMSIRVGLKSNRMENFYLC